MRHAYEWIPGFADSRAPYVPKSWKPVRWRLTIEGSECKQIQRLSEMITQIGLRDVFVPLTRNPVFVSAEKAGCHPSCVIPTAVIKVAEVALGLALKCDVVIQFKS